MFGHIHQRRFPKRNDRCCTQCGTRIPHIQSITTTFVQQLLFTTIPRRTLHCARTAGAAFPIQPELCSTSRHCGVKQNVKLALDEFSVFWPRALGAPANLNAGSQCSESVEPGNGLADRAKARDAVLPSGASRPHCHSASSFCMLMLWSPETDYGTCSTIPMANSAAPTPGPWGHTQPIKALPVGRGTYEREARRA